MVNCLFLFFLIFGAACAQAQLPDIETELMNKNYEQSRLLAGKFLRGPAGPLERVKAEYYLGLSQLRLGEYAQARKAFQIVMHATSDRDLYEKAALGIVEGLTMAGFYKEALKEAQTLLRKHPDSPSKSLIYYRIARAHLKLMQWQNAKEYLQKIIDEFPQSFEAPLAKALLEEKEYFAVQVGSFLDKDKAVALMEELKVKGQYAYVVETSSDEKTFFRVRVGQAASLRDAQTLKTQLGELGYPTLIYP